MDTSLANHHGKLLTQMDSDAFLAKHVPPHQVFCINCGDVPSYDYINAMPRTDGDTFNIVSVDNCFEPQWFCQTCNKMEFEK